MIRKPKRVHHPSVDGLAVSDEDELLQQKSAKRSRYGQGGGGYSGSSSSSSGSDNDIRRDMRRLDIKTQARSVGVKNEGKKMTLAEIASLAVTHKEISAAAAAATASLKLDNKHTKPASTDPLADKQVEKSRERANAMAGVLTRQQTQQQSSGQLQGEYDSAKIDARISRYLGPRSRSAYSSTLPGWPNSDGGGGANSCSAAAAIAAAAAGSAPAPPGGPIEDWKPYNVFSMDVRGPSGYRLTDAEIEAEHTDFCFACLYSPKVSNGVLLEDHRLFEQKALVVVQRMTPKDACGIIQRYYETRFYNKIRKESEARVEESKRGRKWSLASIYYHFYKTQNDAPVFHARVLRALEHVVERTISGGLLEQSSATNEIRVNPSSLKIIEKYLDRMHKTEKPVRTTSR